MTFLVAEGWLEVRYIKMNYSTIGCQNNRKVLIWWFFCSSGFYQKKVTKDFVTNSKQIGILILFFCRFKFYHNFFPCHRILRKKTWNQRPYRMGRDNIAYQGKTPLCLLKKVSCRSRLELVHCKLKYAEMTFRIFLSFCRIYLKKYCGDGWLAWWADGYTLNVTHGHFRSNSDWFNS